MKNNCFFLLAMVAVFFRTELFAQYYSGYGEDVRGEIIRYESQQPDADSALLVRSLDERKSIEWLTLPAPPQPGADTLEFLMIAGIDVNPEDPHTFYMAINGKEAFTFSSPADTVEKSLCFIPSPGYRISFIPAMIDKYGDLFGYMFLKVPAEAIEPGKPLRISVRGESAGSRTWFMVFRYQTLAGIAFSQEEAILKEGEKKFYQIKTEILHFSSPGEVIISIGEARQSFPLQLGYNLFRVSYPYMDKPVPVRASVRLNDKELAEQSMILTPVNPITVYLLPHSHVDIGYTHVQQDVERIQWQNLERAIELSEQTADYPEGAVFKWNTEVMWAVESYFNQADDIQRERLFNAVEKGRLGLDALYANILTGLCSNEELYRMMESGRRIASLCGVSADAAMISDIPGYTWGMVDALAQHGIRYFSIGTNTFHRIGAIIENWGDKPFYWRSASGNDSVLCWVHGKGYSEFHTGLGYASLQNKLKDQRILDYIRHLRSSGYEHDMIPLRYNIGSDNGPPDSLLPGIVRLWNERYHSPVLKIATTSEFFSLFEGKHGSRLPSFSGDFTGYWEDGAASSARETAMSRAAGGRLIQAECLWALSAPESYPAKRFSDAWKNVLLFHEHTWGSWNSISEPFSPFTLTQWEVKRAFAEKAHEASESLLADAFPKSLAETVTSVDIINTLSWERSDIAVIPAGCHLRGEIIRDDIGNIIPSQRLSTGELVFMAAGIPALASRRYYLEPGKAETENAPPEGFEYFYHGVGFTIDPASGAIKRLGFEQFDGNFADTSRFSGLNDYLYVEGRLPGRWAVSGKPSVAVKEYGPVLMTVSLTSDAPGCAALERKITVVNGAGRIDIENILDKKQIFEPEGVHFAFPFNLKDPVIRISQPWGHYVPGTGQLSGSNKNFYSLHRWVDITGEGRGITWISRDAPLAELNEITNDATEYGWISAVPQTSTVLSYVMNNYWETNYRAAQEGKAIFRYSLCPHGQFDPVQAEKAGQQVYQPLLTVVSDRFMPQVSADFSLGNENILISSLKPVDEGLLVKFTSVH
ncbi:MAG: hypothetical protein JXA03_06120 [Bacteroidales bacterium]|nr:hypothetical protein [Bacteroidales bacterium]